MMVTYLWRGTRIDDWFRISIKGQKLKSDILPLYMHGVTKMERDDKKCNKGFYSALQKGVGE